MNTQAMLAELNTTNTFLQNSISCLTEEDSGFAPKDGMFTVAQQVGHIAQTIDWFIGPVETDQGFDVDFEAFDKKIREVTSLDAASKHLDQAIKAAITLIESKDDAYFAQPLPQGPIMGGLPKFCVFGAIADHTAHHRGALTVYSRLLGKTPKMPYGDM